MKATDIARRSLKNLKQAKGRTILTALAISVGAFTICTALAAGEGGRAMTDQMIAGSGDDSAIYVYPKMDTGSNGTTSDGQSSEMAEYDANATGDSAAQTTTQTDEDMVSSSDLAEFKKIEHVTYALGEPMTSAEPVYAYSSMNSKKYVAPVMTKTDKTALTLEAGSLNDNLLSPGTVAVSDEYVKQFGFDSAEDAIGKTITIGFRDYQSTDATVKEYTYKIVAVDKKSDTAFYYQSGISMSAEDSVTVAKDFLGSSKELTYYSATVGVDSKDNISSVQDQLSLIGTYEFSSLADFRTELLQMVNTVQWGLVGFGALALLASVFGIVNTMYISVLERTSQIGLMKALGASRRDIGRLFRNEAAWVGLLGALIGVGASALLMLLNPAIASALQLDEGTRLLIINPLYTLALVAGLVLLAILSGFFPSRRAAKMDPIEALRTE